MPTTTDRAARLARKAHTANIRAKALKPQSLANEPGVFMHEARAPHSIGGEYAHQRHFGCTGVSLAFLEKNTKNYLGYTRVTVYRNARNDDADLEIKARIDGISASEMCLTLSADELQLLACALLDAAHDLRTHPAKDYTPGGAA